MPTFGICALNSRDSLQVIATGAELLTHRLNSVQPKHAVPFRVPIFVYVAEFWKVSLKYLVKLVLTDSNVYPGSGGTGEREVGERLGGIRVGCENSPRRCCLGGLEERRADMDTASGVDLGCFALLVAR